MRLRTALLAFTLLAGPTAACAQIRATTPATITPAVALARADFSRLTANSTSNPALPNRRMAKAKSSTPQFTLSVKSMLTAGRRSKATIPPHTRVRQ